MNTKILKNKNFLLYLLGHNTSIFGDLLLMTGFALYIMKVTASTMQFSMTIAISFIPRILISPYAGVVVDRLKKKKLVILLDLFRGFLLLILWHYSRQNTLSLPMIYGTLLTFAVCDCFFGPAFSTIYPKIMKEAHYAEGNAISNTLTSVTNTISPLIASLLFMKFGLAVLLFVDAITFFLSAASEFFLEFNDHLRKSKRKVYSEFLEGLKMVKDNARMKSLLLNGNLTHLFLFPFIEAGVVYLLFVMFKAPETDYGIVRACISAGAIFSGFVAMAYQKKKSIASNINIGILWMMGAVTLFLLLIFKDFCDILYKTDYLPVIYLSITCFIMFFAFGFYGVFYRSFYQKAVPNHMLGRYISIMSMTFSVAR